VLASNPLARVNLAAVTCESVSALALALGALTTVEAGDAGAGVNLAVLTSETIDAHAETTLADGAVLAVNVQALFTRWRCNFATSTLEVTEAVAGTCGGHAVTTVQAGDTTALVGRIDLCASSTLPAGRANAHVVHALTAIEAVCGVAASLDLATGTSVSGSTGALALNAGTTVLALDASAEEVHRLVGNLNGWRSNSRSCWLGILLSTEAEVRTPSSHTLGDGLDQACLGTFAFDSCLNFRAELRLEGRADLLSHEVLQRREVHTCGNSR